MKNYSELFGKQMIDGQWVNPSTTHRVNVENPATREIIAGIPAGSESDARKAIEAAERAFSAWAKTPVEERIHLMEHLLQYLHAAREEIVFWESAELGMPKAYVRRKHCDYQLSRIEAYIECTRQIRFLSRRKKAAVRIEPLGVVSCLTPWNYPLGQIIQKVIPALLMGNTVVLKPSSLAPLTSVILAEAFRQAGFPDGVFNLINGVGTRFGGVLTDHPSVGMISFTGSTEIGRALAMRAAAGLKRINLELGGKSPCIWLPGIDDYEPACRTLFNSVFLNAGQTCTSLSRLLIPESMKDEAEKLLKRFCSEYRIGMPDDPLAVVGPVISRGQYDRVSDFIRLGLKEGATLLVGEVPPAEPQGGWFIRPVIFTDVTENMHIAQEEIFGPVLCVMTYRDREDALRIANGTKYGLSSAVFGPAGEAEAFAAELEAGNVFINNSPRDITAPFGGFKESGIGYESGVEGLMAFTHIKSIFDGRKA